jgi:non-ribosomal peptide synthetase component F
MYDDEFWARADELFDAALDLPSESRARWLDAVCASEPDLRAKVEQLLELSESEDERLRPNRIAAEIVRELVSRFQSRDTLRSCPGPRKPSSSR